MLMQVNTFTALIQVKFQTFRKKHIIYNDAVHECLGYYITRNFDYMQPIIIRLQKRAGHLNSTRNTIKAHGISSGKDVRQISLKPDFQIGEILTLRRLMSYIYIYIYIYIYMEHPFLMFLDHTQRRNTVGKTPLDE